jgi:AraC-like DNA-binding protein
MLVLDTDALPAGHRADALLAAMTSSLVPSRVHVAHGGGEIRARVQSWRLGPSAHLLHVESSGHRMARTSQHLRGGAQERISLAIQLAGRSRLAHRDLPAAALGELQLVDLTSPFRYATGVASAAQALYVDTAQLGLSVDVVRAAAPRLRASPLHGLTRDHLLRVRQLADGVPDARTAALLGAATVELVRALIASAADVRDDRDGDALLTRVTAYMLAHLGEADLDPSRVAAEHHMSVRSLHLLFSRQDLSVRRWLMHERLEAARRVLARADPERSSIAAIARNHGFPDPGHFARRFRRAYGMSPREWQQLQLPPPDGPSGRGPVARG